MNLTHVIQKTWKYDISVGFLKLKIFFILEYIHILYQQKDEALQIPIVFESSHLVHYSLIYGDVNMVDMFIIRPTTRKSWLSKYDIRVALLKLKIFLIPQNRFIIHLFEDEAL